VSTLALPPLSLYIHIPWCERKCPYCDFNSHQQEGHLPEAEYVAALLRDLDRDLPLAQGRPLVSIFIGGGTPSLLSVPSLQSLLDGVRARLALDPDCEITLEANPGSAEAEKFAGFVAAGINRISLGVQSFDDDCLRALGRVHDAAQARSAVAIAQASGIDSLNIDLMHGLPDQTAAMAEADLRQALDFAPAHLSWYQLTIERNTAFYKRPPELPVEDALGEIQARGEALLAAADYTNYEVSAYARPGFRCRHNLNYWEFGDYLGIGAGAHGKLTLPEAGEIRRTVKRRQPAEYLAAEDANARGQVLDRRDLPGDFMLNALRLTEGFAPGLYSARTGLALETAMPTLESLAARDLLDVSAERICPTPLGRRYLDSVVSEFL
jgi:oxygen-independent coproporphyrinogen-3 oxidase